MKLPKTFRVGRKKFVVTEVDRLPRDHRGIVKHSAAHVHIARGHRWGTYSPRQRHETLLHEMTHAVLRSMDDRFNTEDFVQPFAEKLAKAIMSARF